MWHHTNRIITFCISNTSKRIRASDLTHRVDRCQYTRYTLSVSNQGITSSYVRAPEGKRVLVSAPRPDSFMLRLRSLREAGRLGLSPTSRVWRDTNAPQPPGPGILPDPVAQSLFR